jgi:diaminohydroxyphosphoribosylaminopyrimidine deaminase/5-amino-6-(5-phosphoribosylamino)uracil reductase
LIAAGIARVVFASGDPNPEVNGRGVERLRAAGIVVEQGLMAEEGEALNRGFFSRMRRGRPWLRVKLAASLDGRTALASGESRWITSEAARADVQRWRAESAAILSTSATVIADDPALSVREGECSRAPLRVLLDRQLRIPATARVFATPGEIVRLASAQADDSRAPAGRIEREARDQQGLLSLPEVLAWMGRERLNEVWSELGATLAGALVTAGLVDELVLYLAPRLLGPDARPLLALPTLSHLADAPDWQVCDLRQIGPDIRIILRHDRR